jgi:hypothetical protein
MFAVGHDIDPNVTGSFTSGAFGRMVPERINGSPNKELCMNLAGDLDEAVFEMAFPSEDQTAAKCLENDDDHQQHCRENPDGDVFQGVIVQAFLFSYWISQSVIGLPAPLIF